FHCARDPGKADGRAARLAGHGGRSAGEKQHGSPSVSTLPEHFVSTLLHDAPRPRVLRIDQTDTSRASELRIRPGQHRLGRLRGISVAMKSWHERETELRVALHRR